MKTIAETAKGPPKKLSLAAWIASKPKETWKPLLGNPTEAEYERLFWSWDFWARPEQLPPEGDWRTWLVLAGRGFGKTRTGAEWVRGLVESNRAARIALVAPTAADARDVMVEGESGILSVSPKWFRPKYEPSKRRLTWPNGAMATTYSADEPERLRGPQHDAAWCDEVGAWRYPQTWDMLKFGLRLRSPKGDRPRACVTTTPKPVPLVKKLVAAKATAKTTGSTFDNFANLSEDFIEEMREVYEGTRLGLQELYAELLDIADGAWFASFNTSKHVSESAEYKPYLPVHIAVDCGTSRHTGAVYFQVQPITNHRNFVTVFADYYAVDLYSEVNAQGIRAKCSEVCEGRFDVVRVDPAATAKTGVGPAAFGEYQRVFGRTIDYWPMHRVADGLDQIEVLMGGPERETDIVVHPRCTWTIDAFKNYQRAEGPGGEWLAHPKDPQHPHEEMMDSLRGGLRAAFPEGRKPQPAYSRVKASKVF